MARHIVDIGGFEDSSIIDMELSDPQVRFLKYLESLTEITWRGTVRVRDYPDSSDDSWDACYDREESARNAAILDKRIPGWRECGE